MRNNIYIRSNRSIKTISITKICFLIPLVIYGLYKNGIYLYKEHLISFIEIFRPLIYSLIGAIIGVLVNIFYEKVVKKHDNDIVSAIFSSFHVEYGIIIGLLVPLNTNVILYTIVVITMFILSKFLNNRVNVMCASLIVIYLLSQIFFDFTFLNVHEASKTFEYEFMDYLIGKYPGGVGSTHVILILLGTFGLYMTNNIKASISLSSLVILFFLFGIYSLITSSDFSSLIFSSNIPMIMCYVQTDTKTSSYTKKGMITFGVLTGILTFALTFITPIYAPLISVLLISVLNNLIDRLVN